MAQSIDDFPVNKTWQSLNTLSGVAVGNSFEVINKSNRRLLLMTGAQPAVGSTSGIPLTTLKDGFANRIFSSSELEVWCRVGGDTGGDAVVHVVAL